MNKYCTYTTSIRLPKFQYPGSPRRLRKNWCGAIAVAPHPYLAQQALCQEHLKHVQFYIQSVQEATS